MEKSNRLEICEACVDLAPQCTGRDELLRHLAGLMAGQGYVDEVYGDKIVEREASYPTGLQFGDIAIALPHGDPAYVRQSAAAVARCPGVKFHGMEDPDEEIPVDLVVMLAVKDPDAHLAVLNNLMQMFTKPEMCRDVLKASDPTEICRLFQSALYDS